MLSTNEILKEYGKCIIDPGYGIETYLETFDKTQEGFVPFKLFKKQKEIVNAYQKHRFNLVAKPRQAGVSTTTAAFAAIKAATADANNPEAILILANRREMAQEFLGKIKDFIVQLPRWFWGSEYYGSKKKEEKKIFLKESAAELKLPNKTRIKAVATSKDSLRGFVPTWLIMDEAAFIENGAEVFGSAVSSLSTGGKATLISTPNGMDALYHKTYQQSKAGDNNFNVIEMRWYQDPRYNKDLWWTNKNGDIEVETEFTHTSFEKRIEEKWKPNSTWYTNMCKDLNNDKRMISQELDVSFIGSGGNVIDDEYIEEQKNKYQKEPIYKNGLNKDIWVWKKPIPGHQYIMGVDVARGDGSDKSTFSIIDVNTMELVAEYKGNLRPDELGVLCNEYGLIYNAYMAVDITGGIGVSTVLKLLELEYPNLHYDEPKNKILSSKKNELEAHKREDSKIPGFTINNANRNPMISNLEMVIRTDQFKVRSERTIAEMGTFIYRNGRPDHQIGFHDDLIFSLAIALFVYDNSFTKLKKADEQTKAMLSGWKTNNTNPSLRKKQLQKGNKPRSNNNSNPYSQYSWLIS